MKNLEELRRVTLSASQQKDPKHHVRRHLEDCFRIKDVDEEKHMI